MSSTRSRYQLQVWKWKEEKSVANTESCRVRGARGRKRACSNRAVDGCVPDLSTSDPLGRPLGWWS